MKKLLRKLPVIIIACLVATTTTTLEAKAADTTTQPAFTDISSTFAKQDIEDLYSKGIVSGYDDHTFAPNAPVTRGEFVAMLLRAKGFPVPTDFTGFFRDVQRGEWFSNYVELSYRLGVTSGTADGNWKPNGYLTRQEMIQMTIHALGRDSESARHQDYTTYSRAIAPFGDRGKIASWAVKSMSYAVRTGMIHGTGAGSLLPTTNATRAEVAAFLNRAIVGKVKATPGVMQLPQGGLSYVNQTGVVATAYTYNSVDGVLAYTGLNVRPGMIAVDPAVIPMGSHLYIPGYGYGVAGDQGGKIKQKRVDLFMQSYTQATQFGRQNMNVYVLD
ncbi:MAG: S-layer homology domain-containing protein [Tumebacillaceae bacterium]